MSLDLLCAFLQKLCNQIKNISTSRNKFFHNELFTFFYFFTILNYDLNILFVCYHFKANEIKTPLLKPVRIEAGLGDPPNEFTTNDVQSDNFIIKHGINFGKQKLQETATGLEPTTT